MKLFRKLIGFTLIELLLVLTLVSLLAWIAYPMYTQPMNKARRAEAKIALLELTDRMEDYYIANNNSYKNANLEKLDSAEKTSKGYYKLAVLATTNTTYAVQATATFPDSECTSFTLDQRGNKTSTGTLSECW